MCALWLTKVNFCFYIVVLTHFCARLCVLINADIHLFEYYEIDRLLSFEQIPFHSFVKYRNATATILDSGFNIHPHQNALFDNVIEYKDYTSDGDLNDYGNHGTRILNLLLSNSTSCQGIGSSVQYSFGKVFNFFGQSTDDFFNRALNDIASKSNQQLPRVINLSYGSVISSTNQTLQLIKNLVSRGVVFVAAAGNAGPSRSTNLDPSSLPYVISVGGYDDSTEMISKMSSRGFDNIGFNHHIGIMKPDVIALFGPFLTFDPTTNTCSENAGTSMSAPIVTTLLSFASQYLKIWNIAVAQQLLNYATIQSPHMSRLHQGRGLINTQLLTEMIQMFNPQPSIWPSYIDMTESPCVLNQPFCFQPLFSSSPGMYLNLTIYYPFSSDASITYVGLEIPNRHNVTFEMDSNDCIGQQISAFVGLCGLRFYMIDDIDQDRVESVNVVITIRDDDLSHTSVIVPVKIKQITEPDASRRVLWDVNHQHIYPWGFIPSDYQQHHANQMEWNYDHPYANNWNLFRYLLNHNLFIDIWNQPLSCAKLENYAFLLILDPEDAFDSNEIQTLQNHLNQHEITVWIFVDWYDEQRIRAMHPVLKDSNSQASVFTGGSNVPNLNQLLEPYGVQLDQYQIIQGRPGAPFSDVKLDMATSLVTLPENAWYRIDSFTTVPLSHLVAEVNIEACWLAFVTLESKSRLIVVTDSTPVEDNANQNQFNTAFFDILLGYSHYDTWTSIHFKQTFQNTSKLNHQSYQMPVDLQQQQNENQQHANKQCQIEYSKKPKINKNHSSDTSINQSDHDVTSLSRFFRIAFQINHKI